MINHEQSLSAATYGRVEQLIGFRHPWAPISEALRGAMAWEDHLFTTEVIPDWQNDCARLTLEYNQALPKSSEPLQLPDEPSIDLSKRRSYYQLQVLPAAGVASCRCCPLIMPG